jgi:hypothetical protein
MDLQNLLNLQLFILYMQKNQKKFLICIRGGEKIHQNTAFLGPILSFIVLSIQLSLKIFLFESFDIF